MIERRREVQHVLIGLQVRVDELLLDDRQLFGEGLALFFQRSSLAELLGAVADRGDLCLRVANPPDGVVRFLDAVPDVGKQPELALQVLVGRGHLGMTADLD